MEDIFIERKITYTPARKLAIYKWRETHHDQFLEYSNKWGIEKYHKNPDKFKAYAKAKYYYDKEVKRLRNILLD